MKCPNCEYKHGSFWGVDNEYLDVVGKQGEFFTFPIQAEKGRLEWEKERESVYGCPKCGTMFMDIRE